MKLTSKANPSIFSCPENCRFNKNKYEKLPINVKALITENAGVFLRPSIPINSLIPNTPKMIIIVERITGLSK